MSHLENELFIDCDLNSHADLPPVRRFASLVISMALSEGAEAITFWVEDGADTEPRLLEEPGEQEKKFHISHTAAGGTRELLPAPSLLFPPVARLLCAHASIPYYAKGHVEGKLSVKNPDMVLRLRSDDLQKSITLVRQ
jgi:hypothetical protein